MSYRTRLLALSTVKLTGLVDLAQAEQIVIEADVRVAELEAALKRQAAAVRMLDMSHVARAETMMQHAQVLHDQSNTAALESERAANSLMTERIAELEAALAEARRDAERYRWLVSDPIRWEESYSVSGYILRIDGAKLRGVTIHEAIDAARAGNGGEG